MRRHATAVFAIAALCSFFALAGSALAACPNEGFRAGPSQHLADCRAYEMVSPVDMNGNGIELAFGVRGDGDALAYGTLNAFGDEAKSSITGKWVASRSASGWTSTSLNPPALGRVPTGYDETLTLAVAGDFSSIVLGSPYPFDVRDQAPFGGLSTPGDGDLFRVSSGPVAEWISHGPTLPDTTTLDSSLGGASADLSRVFFETTQPLTAETAGSTASNLYERHGDELVSVNVDESGTLIPGGAAIGRAQAKAAVFLRSSGAQGHPTDSTAVSADGRVAYFTAPLAPTSAKRQLYARVAGTTTVLASRCRFGACDGEGAPSGAAFLLASRDGGTLLFFSQDRLLESAPEGGGIYSFDLGTNSLSFLTAMKGQVVAATPDLSTLYSCTTNALSVFREGEWRLAAPLASCPAAERTGTVAGVGGISSQGEPRSTPNAGYVFATTAGPRDVAAGEAQVVKGEAQVVTGEAMIANGETAAGEFQVTRGNSEIASGKARIARGEAFGGYENAGFAEVYLYDPAAGTFRCVSCRPDGSAAEAGSSLDTAGGDPSRPNPHTSGVKIRNLSEDGRRVIFASEDQLLPQDINGKVDVYEWERNGTGTCTAASSTYSSRSDGCVFLISSGTDHSGAVLQGISADGEDVFFSSSSQLVPVNSGTETQIYDARVDGGIASQQVSPRTDCEGEGCRAPAGGPATVPATTTDSYSGEGNAKPRRRCVKSSRRKAKQARKRHAAHPRVARARGQRAAKPNRKQARQPRCTARSVRRAGK